MVIGDRLKTLREAKNLSQGDIEKRTGLLRCYGDKSPALPKSAKLSTEDSLESSRSGALLMKKLVYVPKS
jgi:transcriptional regulator with XRE-family HTH domain